MSSAKTCSGCETPLPAHAVDGALCSACSQSAAAHTVIMKAPAAELGTIGDFEILGKIGAGGMGAVYKARQISLDRFVALKVLPSQFADDPEYIGRFQREAKVAAGFHHDNLVSVHNYGTADGCHYIAMELVEGENLHQLLRHRRVDMAEALGITVYVAQGLKCGWDTARLVHRDIKPSNIYVSHDGHVKVGDLGLAKSLTSNTTGITHTGTMMGTPHYMSPEQCRGDKTIDFRADVYSLGCMLFEMLTGHPPYPGNDPVAVVHKHLHSPPPGLLKELPGCPVPVVLLVGRMLKKSPRDRHTSYDELIAEIEALYHTLESGAPIDPTQLRRPGQRTTPLPTPVKEPFEWTSTIIGVLILAAVLVIFLPKPARKLGEMVPTPVAGKTAPRPTSLAAATPSATPTPAPAAPAFGPWQPLFTDAEWKETKPGKREVVDGRLHLTGPAATKPQASADGAIRARIQYQHGSMVVGFFARITADHGLYKAELNSDRVVALSHFAPGSTSPSARLGTYSLPKPLQPGDTVLLELRLQGNRLTVLVDGAVAIDTRDSSAPGPGSWGIIASDGWFESVEVQTPLPAAAPVVNPFGPWQPLFTDAEWKESKSRKQIVDGRMNLQGGQQLMKPLPAADGAIRARIRLPELGKYAAVNARALEGSGVYKLQVTQQGSAVVLEYYPWGGKGIELGRKYLSKPFQPGDTLLLELRLQGDHLTVLTDGAVVIEAQDSRLSGPGEWGIIANDGWFESVEVQTPLPAAAPVVKPFGPWQPLFTEAEWKQTVAGRRELVDGRLHLSGPGANNKPQPTADGAIRARIQFQQESKQVALLARVADDGERYKLYILNGRSVELVYIESGNATADSTNTHRLGTHVLSKPLQPGNTLRLELRLQGDRLTVLVDGAVVIEAQDSRSPGPGQWGVFSNDGWFESVEVQTPLPAGPAIAATKDALFVNSLGMKFVPVPGTDVLFCIHETRWRDYGAYAAEGGSVNGRANDWAPYMAKAKPDFPAELINWDNAEAFCAWLSRKEGRTYRLPTDREWSYAVGIGEQEKWDADTTPAGVNKVPDQFPWGTEWPPPKGAGNYRDETFNAKDPRADGKYIVGYDDGFSASAPVMSFTPNRLGIYDLGGNMAEWVGDWYDANKQARVMRGIGWAFDYGRGGLLSSRRVAFKRDPGSPADAIDGFRVVVVHPAPVANAAPASATTPSAATKDAPFANTLGMQFVPVPIVGGPTDGKRVLFSVWETRVQDYAAFATETNRQWPKAEFAQEPTHPAVMMNWNDATAFCAWLTERERKAGRLGATDSYRLPSDHEWSCAVGIGEREDSAALPSEKAGKLVDVYPWGSAWPPPADSGNFWSEELPLGSTWRKANVLYDLAGYRDGYEAPAPVGAYAASGFGLCDLAGNVSEFCEDWFDGTRQTHVTRGSSWRNGLRNSLKASFRYFAAPDVRASNVGFRCVLEVSAPVPSSAAAADGWEDLLAPLTPERLKENGDGWLREGDALRSPDKKFALLPLTERYAGASYQLRVKLRQLRPTEGFAIVLPVADRMVGFAIDGWPSTGFYTSLNLVNGQFGAGLPGSVKGQQISDSKLHELEVTVRLEGANVNFTAVLDGRPLYSWLGPIAALSQSESWKKTPPGTLAFGTMTDIWAVSEVKVKRLGLGATTKDTPFGNTLVK